MELNRFILQMADNARRIRALVEGVSEEQARLKPDPDSWSILEVVNHLLNVEETDFRPFLDLALRQSGEPRPKIATQANERGLSESLQGLVAAREASLAWLRSLTPPDWEATYNAPWGPIKAGDIFAAWIAHDILHMRQLVKLHWAYTTRLLEPYSTDYAGDW